MAGKKTTSKAAGDAAQILSYRHPNKRVNNPDVGLVNPETDPAQPKTAWAYDPHLDPALQFDVQRAQIEKLIDDALASGDQATMRDALAELKRLQSPYLNWAGKAERTSFDIDTVSLHVHERIDPASILSAVRKAMSPTPAIPRSRGRAGVGGWQQPGLFDAPFENVPLRDAIDFYRHERGWANRMIAGDSLLVMNSLLQKESMAGQVQMIYIDPPYGIKYGSNFQPFVNKRDVKDRADADLTQEPEMIKAFRDTWELGIHSYLTYLRDRLLLAKELLHETGSVFVQISDENLHHVREIMDEVFGRANFVSVIAYKTSVGLGEKKIDNVNDFIVWYCRDHDKAKYNQLYFLLERGDAGATRYDFALVDSTKEMKASDLVGDEQDIRFYTDQGLTSRSSGESTNFAITYRGLKMTPTAGGWRTGEMGMERVKKANRIFVTGTGKFRFKKFFDDFGAIGLTNFWEDTGGGIQSRSDPKIYAVQTNTTIIERCLLMTTDPGDLVLDPTCGSGTTAFVAEKWGRRWITCDTSRVAVTLAKQRLMTASYDYYELKYPHEGLKSGFIYKTVPHVTLKSIANNPDIDEIYERMHPAIVSVLARLNELLVGSFEFSVEERAGEATTDPLKTQNSKLKTNNSKPKTPLNEWEVPFEFSDLINEFLVGSFEFSVEERAGEAVTDPLKTQNSKLKTAFDAFHAARQSMQKQMDASIAAHADQETLYDQPQAAKNKLRITGPFTVEAVPFSTVISLELSVSTSVLSSELSVSSEALKTQNSPTENFFTASVARSGESSRQHQWRDELLKTGIRGKGGQMLKFAELETLPGTKYLHCVGTLETHPHPNPPPEGEGTVIKGERVVVSFGPEHAALEQRQVALALDEAAELFPRPKVIVFCAFTFDPEAAKDIDHLKGITALKAQMNTDLLTDDLKKARSSNQSFWLMGQPDIAVVSGEFLVMSDQWRLCRYGWFKELSGLDGVEKIHGLGGDDLFLYALLSQGGAVWDYLSDAQGWNLHTGEYRRGTSQKQSGGIPAVSWNSQRLVGGTGNLDHALREIGVSGLPEFRSTVAALRGNPETAGRLAQVAHELNFPLRQLITKNCQLKTFHEVEVHGFDYFDTAKGELVSGGKNKIAVWMLDTDYDGRSLFPRQVFFPLAGKDDGWFKLKKNIRAELDEEGMKAFHGTVSLPFEAGENRKVAVKIVDDRGIESLKIMEIE